MCSRFNPHHWRNQSKLCEPAGYWVWGHCGVFLPLCLPGELVGGKTLKCGKCLYQGLPWKGSQHIGCSSGQKLCRSICLLSNTSMQYFKGSLTAGGHTRGLDTKRPWSLIQFKLWESPCGKGSGVFYFYANFLKPNCYCLSPLPRGGGGLSSQLQVQPLALSVLRL